MNSRLLAANSNVTDCALEPALDLLREASLVEMSPLLTEDLSLSLRKPDQIHKGPTGQVLHTIFHVTHLNKENTI